MHRLGNFFFRKIAMILLTFNQSRWDHLGIWSRCMVSLPKPPPLYFAWRLQANVRQVGDLSVSIESQTKLKALVQ